MSSSWTTRRLPLASRQARSSDVWPVRFAAARGHSPNWVKVGPYRASSIRGVLTQARVAALAEPDAFVVRPTSDHEGSWLLIRLSAHGDLAACDEANNRGPDGRCIDCTPPFDEGEHQS